MFHVFKFFLNFLFKIVLSYIYLFFYNLQYFLLLQGCMYYLSVLLYRDGVLPIRTSIKLDKRKTANPTPPRIKLGEADCLRDVLSSQSQNHSQRPKKSKVSPMLRWSTQSSQLVYTFKKIRNIFTSQFSFGPISQSKFSFLIRHY